MKDGTVGWNPGKLNPNILRPIGAVDPQVNVVYAETAEQSRPVPAETDGGGWQSTATKNPTGSRC